jgi:hypothetical protein
MAVNFSAPIEAEKMVHGSHTDLTAPVFLLLAQNLGFGLVESTPVHSYALFDCGSAEGKNHAKGRLRYPCWRIFNTCHKPANA